MLPSVPLLFGGVTGFIGGGAFFPLIGDVLPFGEALGPAFAAALALGTESEMMNNYEQASIKSIITRFRGYTECIMKAVLVSMKSICIILHFLL